jgi:hypothetical protein
MNICTTSVVSTIVTPVVMCTHTTGTQLVYVYLGVIVTLAWIHGPNYASVTTRIVVMSKENEIEIE